MGKFVDRIGETSTANCGMQMTIIDYQSYSNVTVMFEDGAIREHVRYSSFRNGTLTHPDQQKKQTKSNDKTGETVTAKCGMKMTIVKYINSGDITVRFEDGCIVKHTRCDRFNKGVVKHPKFDIRRRTNSLPMHNFIITGLAYKEDNGTGNYFCTCQKCKTNDIMSTADMERHARQHDEGVI